MYALLRFLPAGSTRGAAVAATGLLTVLWSAYAVLAVGNVLLGGAPVLLLAVGALVWTAVLR